MSGWNLRLQVAVTSLITITLFDKISTGDTTAPATDSTATLMQIQAFEYTGAANPIVIDASGSLGSQSTGTSIVIPSPSITGPTQAGDLFFEFVGTSSTNGGAGSPAWANATDLSNTTENRMRTGQYIPGTPQSSYTDTAKWITSRTNGGGVVAYEAAASGNSQGILAVF